MWHACLGMLNLLQNNCANIFGKSWVICLFVAFSYTLMEATVLSCPFSWVWSCIPKVLWNNQSPISMERVEWFSWFFCMQLFSSCWIFIEATKLCYFGMALSCIGSQPVILSDILNLKNSETMWVIKLIFCFHWSYKKHYAILGYDPKKLKKLLVIFFAGFFTFDLFDLLIVISGVHCYILLYVFYSLLTR